MNFGAKKGSKYRFWIVENAVNISIVSYYGELGFKFSIIHNPFWLLDNQVEKGSWFRITTSHQDILKKSAKKGSKNYTLNTENQASKGIQPQKFIPVSAPQFSTYKGSATPTPGQKTEPF